MGFLHHTRPAGSLTANCSILEGCRRPSSYDAPAAPDRRGLLRGHLAKRSRPGLNRSISRQAVSLERPRRVTPSSPAARATLRWRRPPLGGERHPRADLVVGPTNPMPRCRSKLNATPSFADFTGKFRAVSPYAPANASCAALHSSSEAARTAGRVPDRDPDRGRHPRWWPARRAQHRDPPTDSRPGNAPRRGHDRNATPASDPA